MSAATAQVEIAPLPDDDASCAVPTIEELIQRHHREIYGFAFGLSKSAADAEDLTQQVFLVAQQKLHQVRESDKALRWLFAITRNCFLKSRRKTRPVPASELELEVDQIPEAMATDEVDSEAIQLAMNSLSDDYRLVLVMFYFQELSYREIAEEMDLPLGTVMSRLSRAKGRLRRALADRLEPGRPARARKSES